MCEPTTIALATLVIVGGVMAYSAQQQAANQSERAQQQNFEETVVESQTAFAQNVNQENSRLGQTAVANSRDLTQVAIDKRKAAATARVAAGEAGVSGLSVDALMADFERSEARYRDGTAQQFEFDKLASQDNIQAFDSERRSRNNAARPQAVQRPDFLSSGLGIATQVVGVSAGAPRTPTTPAPPPRGSTARVQPGQRLDGIY